MAQYCSVVLGTIHDPWPLKILRYHSRGVNPSGISIFMVSPLCSIT
ncbi:MAG: hypothetical protein FWD87_09665 [Spirochaetaceae bacterium]|nr:hypothetical protein [Spirochaetaceae bacterium]